MRTVDSDSDIRRGFSLALILHIGLLLAVIVKGVIFPGRAIPYIPALRVDIVGLPDILKKDLSHVPKTATPDEKKIQEALKAPAKPRPIPKPVPMPPVPKTPDGFKETKTKQKNKSALDRIKALERIKESVEKPSKAPVIKGNKVSKGTNLSAEARETEMSGYYDLLRDRLQENWALPVWLARQQLAAQVLLFIDGRGHVEGMKLMKSSGNAQFDEAVRGCIRSSEPFPPPPSELAGSISSNGILVGFPL